MAITPTSTTTDLIKEIEQSSSFTEIIDIIKHKNADEAVLNKAIEKSTKYQKKHKFKILSAIIYCPLVTPDVLVNVVKNADYARNIISAMNSPKADGTVFKAAWKVSISNKFNTDTSMLIGTIADNKFGKLVQQNNNTSKNTVDKPTENEESEKLPIEKEETITEKETVIKEEAIMKNEFVTEEEKNVTERLRRNVEDGMSTMLWGLSGIGKTARVRAVDPDFTMIKLKNGMLPEEVTGGKEPNGEPGEIYSPTWYTKLCEKCKATPDKMHILFIDELTNVRDNVKTLVWDIIGDRRVNGNEDWELPENCAIVAAGNRPEESTAVVTDYNGGVLPEPLHDRFDFHIEIPLDMEEWRLWALETNPKTGNLNIHPTVLSFCIARPKKVMFSQLDTKDVTKPRLSPRRWEKLSKAIYMAEKRGGKQCHVSNQRIIECIGKDLAPAFIAHYERPPLDMNLVENGQYTPEQFPNIDDKLFALSSLVSEYKGNEMAAEDFIASCLGDEYWAIYKELKKQNEEMTIGKSSIKK